MSRDLLLLVDALSREKNVAKDTVFLALEMALASATKKKYSEDIDVRVAVDKNTGAYESFRRWYCFSSTCFQYSSRAAFASSATCVCGLYTNSCLPLSYV